MRINRAIQTHQGRSINASPKTKSCSWTKFTLISYWQRLHYELMCCIQLSPADEKKRMCWEMAWNDIVVVIFDSLTDNAKKVLRLMTNSCLIAVFWLNVNHLSFPSSCMRKGMNFLQWTIQSNRFAIRISNRTKMAGKTSQVHAKRK